MEINFLFRFHRQSLNCLRFKEMLTLEKTYVVQDRAMSSGRLQLVQLTRVCRPAPIANRTVRYWNTLTVSFSKQFSNFVHSSVHRGSGLCWGRQQGARRFGGYKNRAGVDMGRMGAWLGRMGAWLGKCEKTGSMRQYATVCYSILEYVTVC